MKNIRQHQHGAKQGFAIVISLLLMGFIVLLLLSLSTLTRVELQATALQKDILIAKGNAIVGMQVALGELQKLAGPDQRVTATASLLPDFGEPQHTHWTAVWDVSNQQPHSPYVSPNRLGWLVSGVDASGDPLEPGSAVDEPITLVGANSVAEAADQVVVGKVQMHGSSASKVSHYAYWVSDEGVKAKLNLNDPFRDLDAGNGVETRYSLMSSQRNGIEKIKLSADGSTLLESVIDPLEATTAETLTNLDAMSELGLLSENAELRSMPQRRFHDLTTVGAGLLTNVTDGGLRKDLSLAFEMDLTDFNSDPLFASGGETIPALTGHQVNYLFRLSDFDSPEPVISDPVLRGPTWHLLRNFYRLYKTDDPDRNQPYKTGNPGGVTPNGNGYTIVARPTFPQERKGDFNAHSIPNSYFYTENDVAVNDIFTGSGRVPRATDMSIAPVVLRMQAFFSVQAVDLNEGDATIEESEHEYRVDLQVNPVITIWNPYNVALEFDELTVTWRNFGLELEVEVAEPDATGQPSKEETFFASGEKTVIRMKLKSPGGGSTRLDPGAVRIYSMQSVMTGVGGSAYELEAECYPNFGTLESQALNYGFRFNSILADGSSLVVPFGTKIALAGGGSSMIMDAVLGREIGSDVDTKKVTLGQFYIPRLGPESQFRWPTDDDSDLYAVEDLESSDGPGIHPVAMIDTYQKPASANDPVQFLAHYNPRAANFVRSTGRKGAHSGEDIPISGNWSFGIDRMVNWSDTSIAIVGDAGFWGSDNGTYGGGESEVVLFEIPTLPMQSLAGFQHVNNWTIYAQTPAYVVGNSHASPFIPRDQVTRTILDDSYGYTQADWSYLSNEALWDDYFFSTLAPRPDLDEDDLEVLLASYLEGEPMPNSRIFFSSSAEGYDEASIVADIITGNSIDSEAYARIAKYLMLDGAFNVNSTSVEAWKTVLSATNRMNIEYITGASTSATANDQSAPYSRMSLPAGNSNDAWSGFRELSDDEVEDLAEAIVEQVKLRGPFVSLSDFVNRRLVDDETGLLGALQAAIDQTDINDGITSSEVTTADLSAAELGYPEHGVGPIEAGATGYLRQSDLLMTLGPVLSARSDTFRIRAYGDTVDSITGVTVSAWCEVVVQRVNEFVDSDDDATTAYTNLSEENKQFGRRFEIVSFRWLREEEI